MATESTEASTPRPDHRPGQLAIGVGAVLLAAALAYGAANIPSDAGYAGVGPDFLPWVVSAAMRRAPAIQSVPGAEQPACSP